jgi:cation diffusion facilitator CzcD-associated flavoprotein CzcO
MEEEFDALAICNGHYSQPLWPSVSGLDKFKGVVLHSHSYRKPEPFRNRRVVVLGGGQSGRDISQELCRVAEVVVLSHRSAAVSVYIFAFHWAKR